MALGRYRRIREEAIAAWIGQLECGARRPAGLAKPSGGGR
jgi:hypothetical protein